jgi:hypothetical protein
MPFGPDISAENISARIIYGDEIRGEYVYVHQVDSDHLHGGHVNAHDSLVVGGWQHHELYESFQVIELGAGEILLTSYILIHGDEPGSLAPYVLEELPLIDTVKRLLSDVATLKSEVAELKKKALG